MEYPQYIKILPAKEHVYHLLKLVAADLRSVLDVVLGDGCQAGSYEINVRPWTRFLKEPE